MNKHLWKTQLTPYEADYAQWCAEQGALLREGDLSKLDRDNLAEEIESLGRSEKSEIENRLSVLLVHLLKWMYQPDQRSGSWRATIAEQRARLGKRLKDNPSLRNYPAEILDEEYALARLKAAGETGLSQESFPADCPLSLDLILDAKVFPDVN
jgi:hypothetical protein